MTVLAPATALTRRSALELARLVREGRASVREIVDAHIEVLERRRLNAVVVERFEQARVEADEADRRIATGEEDLPPLLGVPCTVKESFAVAGLPNTSGLVSRRDVRAERTATAPARLLGAGAILLGLTNLSELTLWIESDNRVYGRTQNPYDPRRTPGGSSGGEGAAVGSGGSPVGLGTDFGGSIRLPAFFNGVFGHKPTRGLVPMSGHFPSSAGEAMRMAAPGPLARRAEDLMPLLRILAGPDGEDPLVEEVELGDQAQVRIEGLPVVLAERASYVPVKRELREARDRAADALAQRGADVRRVQMRSLRRVTELYLAAVSHGAGLSVADLIVEEGGERARWRSALRRGGPHTLATHLLLWAERSSRWIPEKRIRRALAAARALRDEFDAVLEGGVLLHPPHPCVAPRHGGTVARPWRLAPTAVFNLLGLPATQVPLGLNRHGVPVGVQVVAAERRDHMTIAVAQALEDACGGWVPPPA